MVTVKKGKCTVFVTFLIQKYEGEHYMQTFLLFLQTFSQHCISYKALYIIYNVCHFILSLSSIFFVLPIFLQPFYKNHFHEQIQNMSFNCTVIVLNNEWSACYQSVDWSDLQIIRMALQHDLPAQWQCCSSKYRQLLIGSYTHIQQNSCSVTKQSLCSNKPRSSNQSQTDFKRHIKVRL